MKEMKGGENEKDESYIFSLSTGYQNLDFCVLVSPMKIYKTLRPNKAQ